MLSQVILYSYSYCNTIKWIDSTNLFLIVDLKCSPILASIGIIIKIVRENKSVNLYNWGNKQIKLPNHSNIIEYHSSLQKYQNDNLRN